MNCLLEGKHTWARDAPAVALECIRQTFSWNNRPNRVAQHDLGPGSATLTFEATRGGIYVHQMAGMISGKAREVVAIPEGVEAVALLALGCRAEPWIGNPGLLIRDEHPRTRRPLDEFVFGGKWGKPGLASSE